MSEQHSNFGGKIHVYKRRNNSLWCSSYFADKNRRPSQGLSREVVDTRREHLSSGSPGDGEGMVQTARH
jgi:hypothetical protein